TITPGTGLSCASAPAYGTTHYSWSSADFNGDGKDDLVEYFHDSTAFDLTPFVFLSTGTGFTLSTWGTGRINAQSNFSIAFGDFNGDGKSDILVESLQGLIPGNDHHPDVYTNCVGTLFTSTGTAFQISGVAVPSCLQMSPNLL